MNRHHRRALAAIDAAGAKVVGTTHGTHLELTIEKEGRRGVLRLHLGGKVAQRAERGLRSQIRRIVNAS